jgi:hypothetical protein
LRKCNHHFHQSSVGVDSSNRQRPFRSFRLRDPSKFHPILHIIHLPHYILSVQAGLSANRKEKIGWCNIRAMWWLWCAFESRNIQLLLGCPCRVNLCIVDMNQSQGFARFWNLAAFSERVDQVLLHKRMVNLMCCILEVSNSVRPVKAPENDQYALFTCNCPFDTDW